MNVNREARRHNALIRANSLDEPLIPLLRPPPQPLNISIPSIGSGSAIPHPTSNSNTNKALSAYTETEHAPPPLPLTARVFSESQAHSHIRNPKKLGKLDTGVGRLRRELGGVGGVGGEVGTPSPFFPRDLMGLMRMGGEDAKMLLREYGLVRVRRRVVGKEKEKEVGVDGESVEGDGGEREGEGGEKEVEEVVEEEEEETREESINRFLAYIGVSASIAGSCGS